MKEQGKLDLHTVEALYQMKQDEKYLEMHKNKVWQGKDGKWRTHLPKANGERKLVKRSTKEDVEAAIIEHYKNPEAINDFSSCFFSWVERQRNCGRADNTINHYKADYRRFFLDDEFEKYAVEDITEETICIFIKRKLDNIEMPYSSLKAMFGYIRGVLDKCIRDKMIQDNPCKYVDLEMYKKYCVERSKEASKRTLSDEELELLLDKLFTSYVEKPWYIPQYAIELTIYMGLRVGELSGLKWSDIDYKNQTVTIQRSEKFNRETKEYFIDEVKNHKIRVLPLTEEIREVLDRIKSVETRYGYLCEWVFANEGGRIHASVISDCIRNRTMGKDFDHTKSIHAIRRTFNSKLKCLGVSTTVAASLLGHTEKVNQDNYTYDVSTIDYKREVMNEMWAKAR